MKKIFCLSLLILFITGCATMNTDLSRMSDDEVISYYQDTKSQLDYYEGQRETDFGTLQSTLTRSGDIDRTATLTQKLLEIRDEIKRRGLNIPY
ncbi:MAG: hypothetical protein PHH69_07565 [Candidatus Omnitrophica bacterium]|nr:hypothetical protein [Candidatus Omnitrophota bacterium]MDD5611364.1 hypothetical protein [Candidatus Omnitrophota bacterium]